MRSHFFRVLQFFFPPWPFRYAGCALCLRLHSWLSCDRALCVCGSMGDGMRRNQVMFEGSKSEALAVQMADHQRQISVGRFLKFGVSLKIFLATWGSSFAVSFGMIGMVWMVCCVPPRSDPHPIAAIAMVYPKLTPGPELFAFPVFNSTMKRVICGAWLGMAMIQMKTQ